MDKAQKIKVLRQKNVLESLKDIGSQTTQSLKKDLLADSSEELLRQLFGERQPQKYSGDIAPGESIEMADLYSGKVEEVKKLKKQISFERRLDSEEKSFTEKRSNELKLQLHALMQEVYELAKSTQNIGEEIEVASMQAPANPGIYHVGFFEKLIVFVRSFREKIEDASVWLQSSNKKAEKKNFWTSFKKSGSSFLLAPDHYLQRSAG